MKKIILMLFVGILMLMLSTSFFVIERASAEMEKPLWKRGDYWDNELIWYTEDDTISRNGRFEIKDEKTITINGKSKS